MNRTRRLASGITLVELMIVIAIVAILMAIAFPTFRSSRRSNRMATTSNLLMSSVALARSEAIRSANGAQMCASASGTSCGGTWNDGWIVWADADADGVLDATEPVVRHVQLNPSLTLTEASGGGSIVFSSRGTVVPGSASSFTLTPEHCPASRSLVNSLTVNFSGQVNSAEVACP